MLFLRKERDRFAWFLSDGGVRSNLDRERFVEIDIDLPPIPVQRKYVDAYNAMLANQRAYERDLEGLKLTCDVYIERLR
ncbi:MAG: hypothetical protein LBF58_02860 [Deltaproteobacteria bacterium]|jgi:type I restriction enzyme S subunit|nr:hypothetical protein [Deltaproteobacteria bacterium]